MADSTDLRGITLNRWTLTFSDRDFERQFHQSWLKATARVDRYWVIGGLGFLAIFTLLLLIVLPADRQGFLWIRYEIMLPIVSLLQIPVFLRTRRQGVLCLTYFVGSFIVFGTALFLFVTSHRDHNLLFLFEMAAIFVFCQQYNRVLFRNSVVFSLIAGGATMTMITLDHSLVGIPFAPAIFAVFAHAMVGVFSGYGRELFVRRNYLSMKVLKAESARSAELAEQANAASEAKSRFLAIVSHELRTPLNAIIGYTEAMRSGIYGPMADGRVRNAVVDIHDSGARLLTIVNDVLELSNATHGTVELNESIFDLTALIADMQSSFEPECALKGIKLFMIVDQDLPLLSADPRIVRRILSNLLSNALKYTNKDGEIWLTAGAVDDGTLTIWIKDTGIGIAPDKLERAMEAFGQVEDDLNRRYEGIGIGLPLTRSLIELHGGSFTVESQVGHGTRVQVTFPAERAVKGQAPAAIAGPTAA